MLADASVAVSKQLIELLFVDQNLDVRIPHRRSLHIYILAGRLQAAAPCV